jgi:hypothetical protein
VAFQYKFAISIVFYTAKHKLALSLTKKIAFASKVQHIISHNGIISYTRQRLSLELLRNEEKMLWKTGHC